MAYLLREGEHVEAVHDRHLHGLFSRATWLRLLADVGFEATSRTYRLTSMSEPLEAFVGLRSGA